MTAIETGFPIRYAWAMPCADTFDCPPIREFVLTHLAGRLRSVDPFARNSRLATVTNDLNPQTDAQFHVDAVAFLEQMRASGERFDAAILDPPYSPRQVADCYRISGRKVGQRDTQTARLYSDVRKALLPLLDPSAVVLSFGWNSAGMGQKHGFRKIDMLIVGHGGAHNDTICIAETRASA